MIFWWMPLVWLVLVAIAVVVAVRLVRARRRDEPAIPVAHSERLTALPSYRRALSRYRILLGVFMASVLLLLGSSVALTARFASVSIFQPDMNNRDIVLCLDVSGSMVDYDAKVLDVFGQLAEGFTGERVSLVVFNASAVTYFPLTSDYAYISDQLAQLSKDFVAQNNSYYAGTLIGNGSSLIGDGLASCVTRFDATDTERSRSVILVTDNMAAGEEIFSLQEAGELAVERNVRVYGMNPGDTLAKDYLVELATDFRKAVEVTGGAYYALDDPAAVPEIIKKITSEQAAKLTAPPQLVHTDEPALATLLGFLAVAGLMLAGWRLRR